MPVLIRNRTRLSLTVILLDKATPKEAVCQVFENVNTGGVAQSAYLGKLEKKGSVLPSDLDSYVETHWIDHTLLRNDEFQDFIIDRPGNC